MKNILIFCVTFISLFIFQSPKVYAATATAATGGSSISADTTGGSYTTLTGPVISETANKDFPLTGTVVLSAPTGFVFNTGANVTATITLIAGSKACFTFTSTTATPTTSAITFTMSTQDGGGGNPTTTCQVTFSNIQVRPSSGTPLASGNITHTGTAAIAGITGSTNLGTLTEVVGAKNKLAVTTQPSATAAVSTDFAIKPIVTLQDQFGNTVTTDSSSTVSRTAVLSTQICGGTTGSGTLSSTPATGTAVSSGVLTYTAMQYSVIESIKICFTSSGVTSALSNTIVVSAANPDFTQNHYRWYVDSNAENVTDPWSAITGVDIAEDTGINILPVSNDPPDTTQELRLRINITVGTVTITGGTKYFKLQFRTGTDSSCGTGSWTDVGAGQAFDYASSSVTDDTTLTSAKLTGTARLETYSKVKPANTPTGTSALGEDIEFDFHIIGSAAAGASRYLFRVIETDNAGTVSTVLTGYTNCPVLFTKPGMANLMRHGSFFAAETKRGLWWAN